MQRPIDFSKMTIDELTPIVSMRPGKPYSREELRAARAAFMAALGTSEAAASPEEDANLNPTPSVPSPLVLDETALESEAEPTEEVAEPATEDAELTEEVAEPTTENAEPAAEDAEPAAEDAELPAEDARPEATGLADAAAPLEPEDKEAFIMQAESRLARFLYILYAYLLVPLLAAEALVFLLATVATAVSIPNVPQLFLHILSAAVYTMFVSLAWHQFLHRSALGLFLNRALIGVCIFRGVSMVLGGDMVLTGILFLALSLLFFVFFVGYDTTFVVKSQD